MSKNKNINIKGELAKFFAASNEEIYSKALHFSNLAYLYVKVNSADARKALIKINVNIDSSMLSKITLRLSQASEDVLLEPKQLKAIDCAKQLLLDYKEFSDRLSIKAIIELGKSAELCRLAIYRLVQSANPSLNLSVSHELLMLGSGQTSEQVALFYKDAPVLPQELTQLASSTQNAQIIMADIAEHAQRYGVIKDIVKIHPSLAGVVSHNWRQLMSSNELQLHERESLNVIIKSLQHDFPEFKGLSETNRSLRNHLSSEEQMPHEGRQKSLAGLFSAVWGVLSAPQALVALKGLGIAAASTTVAPLLIFAAPIAGAIALEKHCKTEQEDTLEQESMTLARN